MDLPSPWNRPATRNSSAKNHMDLPSPWNRPATRNSSAKNHMNSKMTASRQLSLGNLNIPSTTNSSTKNYMGSPSTASKRPSEVSNNDPPSKRATIVPIQPWNPVRSVQNMFQSAEPVVIDDEDTAPLQKTLEAKVEELFKSHFGMMKNGLAKFKGEFQEEIKAQMEKNSGELKQLIQDEIVSAKRELKTSKSASMKTGTSKSGWNECNENENELQQGSVRYVFNVDKLRTEKTLRSPTVIIGGSEWYLCIKDIGDSLRVILCCNMDSDEFSYDANGRYVLFGQKRAEFEFNHCYAFKSLHIPVLQYLFEQLTDPANGHINDDNHITVQADFNFKRVRNSPIDVRLFSAPTPFCSDCVLVVEDKRLHVNKVLLSVYSAYFDELFNGDPGKNGSNEIVLTDVSITEFVAMLSAIYPTEEQLVITESNVRSMLKMAARFRIPFITGKCEKFLMTCPNEPDGEGLTLSNKLFLAQEYRLNKLKCQCSTDIIQAQKSEIELLKMTVFGSEILIATLRSQIEAFETERQLKQHMDLLQSKGTQIDSGK